MKDKRIEKLRNKQGITLVALVITIVILIILATVAINFAFGNNGLINRAEDAKKYYANDTAYTEEALSNVESYISEIVGEEGEDIEPGEITLVKMFENGKECSEEEVENCNNPEHLHVGDYVNYQNPTSSSKRILAADTEMNEAEKKVTDQEFKITDTENQLGWLVLGIDKETGGLKLIADNCVKNSRFTSVKDPYLYLYGAKGYVNGNNVMDEIASMYTNENASNVRNLKIEDIYELIGLNSEEDMKKYDLLGTYGQDYSLVDKYTPESYLNNKQKVTTTMKENTLLYYINVPEESEVPSLQVSQEILNLIGGKMQNSNLSNKGYNSATGTLGWSYGQIVIDEEDGFRIGAMATASNGIYMFRADGIQYVRELLVRPVAILNPTVTINDINKTDQTFEVEDTSSYVSNPDL